MAEQTVTLRISANADGTIRAVRQVSGELDRMGGQGAAGGAAAARGLKQVEAEGRRASSALDGLVQGAKGFAAAFLSIQGAGALARIADDYTNLSSKIRLVTSSESELADVRRRLVDVSMQTRNDLGSTVTLYSRLAQSTKELGLSQDQLVGMVKTINQAFVVSGATAQEASAAIIQLSQGLAGGALRGEEFNSVAEQAPVIMDLLAKSLGVTRGELRKMAEDGKLTAAVLVTALSEGALEVSQKFGQMGTTIGESFTLLRSALTVFIGQSADTSGAAGAISGSIAALARNLDPLATAVLGVAAVFGARFVAAQVQAAGALVGTQLAARAVAVEMGITAGASTAATTAMTALRGALALVGGPIGLAVLAVTALGFGIYELVQAEKARQAEFEAGVEATEQAAAATAQLVERMREASEVPPPALAVILNDQTEATKRLIEQQEALRAKRAEIANLEAEVQRQQTSTREGAGLSLLAIVPALEEAEQQYAELAGKVNELEGSLGLLTEQLNARLSPAIDAANAAGARFGKSLDNWDITGAISALEDLGAAFDIADAIGGADKAAEAFARDLPKRLTEAREEMGRTGKSAASLAQEWVAAGVAQAETAGHTREHIETLRAQGAELVEIVRQTGLLKQADQNAAKAARERDAAERRALRTREQMREEAEAYAKSNSDAEQSTRNFVDALRTEISDIGKTREELRSLNVIRELENRLIAERADSGVAADRMAEVRALLAEAAAREQAVRQQEELVRAQKEAAKEYERTWLQAADSVSYAIGDFVTGSIRSFKDLARSIGDIFRRMFAYMIAQWVRSGVARIFAGMFGGGGSGAVLAGSGGGGFGQFLQGGFAQALPGLAAVAGGLYGFRNRGGSNGSAGSVLGGAAYAGLGYTAGSIALGGALGASAGAATGAGIGATFGGAASGAMGAASAIPVVGWVLAIAAIVDKLAGGRLFGTRFRPESATQSLSIGEGGGTASMSITEVRNRALFRGRRWRARDVDPGDDARDAAESLFNQIREIMVQSARRLEIEVPPVIEGAIRTVSQFDRRGRVTGTKIFVDVLGRTWEEATAELAATRLSAEAIIATVDAAIGTTVQAAATGIGATIGAAMAQATPEASAIAERWRGDAEALMTGAQFLLAAATDMRAGMALIEGGSLTAITDLVEELAEDGESLAGAYARIAASTNLLRDALDLSGVTIDRTGEALVRFASDITTAAGGLDRAQQLWSGYFSTFFSETERAELALERASASAATRFAEIGLDASGFAGAAGASAFRTLFEQALPTLSADAVVQWLEAAEALGLVFEAQQAYNSSLGLATEVIDGSAEAARRAAELAELIDGVAVSLAEMDMSPLEIELARIDRTMREQIATAVELGAGEVELSLIRTYAARQAARAIEAESEQLREAFARIADAIADLRGRIADDIQGLRAGAPGFDAVAFQRDRIAGLRGQLAGASEADQVGLIDQIRQATMARFDAESDQLRRVAQQQQDAAREVEQANAEAQRAAEQAHAEAMRGWEAQIEAARRLRGFVDSLGLSSVSPLTAFQRFDEAQALYQRALAGGDADALQQAAQAYLEETRAVYGVSDRAVGIFNEVRSALGARANQLASAAAPSFQSPALEHALGQTSAAVVDVEAAIEALRAEAIADLQSLDGLLVELRDQAEARFQSELEALEAQYTQAENNTVLVVDGLGALNADQAVRDAEALAVMREQLAATQALAERSEAQDVVTLQLMERLEARHQAALDVVREDMERLSRAIEQGLRSEARR